MLHYYSDLTQFQFFVALLYKMSLFNRIHPPSTKQKKKKKCPEIFHWMRIHRVTHTNRHAHNPRAVLTPVHVSSFPSPILRVRWNARFTFQSLHISYLVKPSSELLQLPIHSQCDGIPAYPPQMLQQHESMTDTTVQPRTRSSAAVMNTWRSFREMSCLIPIIMRRSPRLRARVCVCVCVGSCVLPHHFLMSKNVGLYDLHKFRAINEISVKTPGWIFSILLIRLCYEPNKIQQI